jgi:hypothetical protein
LPPFAAIHPLPLVALAVLPLALHPLSSRRMLKDIQHGKVPRAYFRSLANALRRARLDLPILRDEQRELIRHELGRVAKWELDK